MRYLSPRSNDKCFYERRQEEKKHRRIIQIRRHCKEGGRDWNDVHKPRTASSPQKLGERHGMDYHQNIQRKPNFADTLSLDFHLPDLLENKFLLF